MKSSNNNFNLNLNEEQKKAVLHGTGPARVIAGPGSGKTTVIINRILHLITHHKILPEHILVITFTKAAALEMQERFQRSSQEHGYKVTFGTFHAIFFQILKQSFHYQHQDILTPIEKQEIILEIISALKNKSEFLSESEDNIQSEEINELLSRISTIRNQTGMSESNHKSQKDTYFETIMKEYEKSKKRMKKLDLDDMILLCYEHLNKDHKQLAYWRERFTYFLIDEFQDINRIQYQMIQLLAYPQNNLFVVGDDDQAIYSFRGSDPKILLHFDRDYPEAEKIMLSANYRSSNEIVIAAEKVISDNDIRIQKSIQSKSEQKGCLVCHGFQCRDEEVINIIKMLEKMLLYRAPSEITILSRTASSFELLAEQLSISKIPFTLRDKITDFYSRPVIDVILSYIRFALTGRREYFLKIMNKPLRYIKRYGIDDVTISCRELLRKNQYSHMVTEQILKLDYDLKMIRGMSPYAAVNYIRKGIGYEVYLNQESYKNGRSFQNSKELLDELQKRASAFLTLEDWICHIEEFQCQMKNTQSIRAKENSGSERNNTITLMTYHASKGLEWACVIMPFVNEGIIPHSKASNAEEIEEERRMFYVAMTRAKTELYIFWSEYNQDKRLHHSRYITKLIKKENR